MLMCATQAVSDLQSVNEQARARNSSALGSEPREGSVLEESDPTSTSPIFSDVSAPEASMVTFEALLDSTFDTLDTDGDGLLTSSDFAAEEPSYEELRPYVDPVLLYADRNAEGRGSGMTAGVGYMKMHQMKQGSARASSHHPRPGSLTGIHETGEPRSSLGVDTPQDEELILDEENSFDTSQFNESVPLNKTNSLWMSISNEKVLPSADTSVSLSGLAEAETEVFSLVNSAKDVIDESESTTMALLVYYKWDLKKLIEDYVENHRAARLVVGLGPRSEPPFLRYDHNNTKNLCDGGDSNHHNDSYVVCGICQDKFPGKEVYALNCFHWYCEECWEGYLGSAIGCRETRIKCPEPGCNMIATPDMYSFFCNQATVEESLRSLIRAFVEERRGVHIVTSYCKNPKGCAGVVLMADGADSSEATCSLCNSSFCAACDLPPHAPATCDLVAKWEEKGGYPETGKEEDAEARKLKHLTTKPCPKCGVRIEKAGGCPHMTCMQPACRYQFCWDCGGDYHTSTQCSRPKVVPQAGSVLAFDELDKQCANHFLARQVAAKGYSACLAELERSQRPEEATLLKIKAEDGKCYPMRSRLWLTLALSCTMLNLPS